MSVELDGGMLANAGDTPSYHEGLRHLQAGEWQAAIRCLEDAARQRPEDAEIRRALSEARFKADLDAQGRVRGQRWIFPWRSVVPRVLAVVALTIAALVAMQFVMSRVAPEVQAAQVSQKLSGSLSEGKRNLEAGEFARARTAFERVLALDANNEEAAAALKQLEGEQALADLYRDGVAAQQAGDVKQALEKFNDILNRRSVYRDVSIRIGDIKQRKTEDGLFSRAEGDYRAGSCASAIEGYLQLQSLNANYQRDLVAGRLFDCYMRLGRDIVDQRPAMLDRLPQAREYFRQAAALKPRDTDSASQERLLTVFLGGQAAFEARNWDESARWFETVFGQRKGYSGRRLSAPAL